MNSFNLRAYSYLNSLSEIFIGYNCLECFGKCKHCWAEDLDYEEYIPVEDLEPAVKCMSDWFEQNMVTNPNFLFGILKNGINYSNWRKYHLLLIKYCDIPSEYPFVVSLSGMKKLPDEELFDFFYRAKEIGIRWVCTSIHGHKNEHDTFCCSNGDYEYFLNALRIAQEVGLKTNILFFLSKLNIYTIDKVYHDFSPVVSYLKDLPLISVRLMQPWGLAKNLTSIFLDEGDLKYIPLHVQKNWFGGVDTEKNYIIRKEPLLINDFQIFLKSDFIKNPSASQFEQIVLETVNKELNKPSLETLIKLKGNPNGKMLLRPEGFKTLLEMRN